MSHGGEGRILVDDGSVEGHPRMLIEPASDHLTVFRPVVIRIERGVNTDETLPVVLYEGEHVLLLAGVHVEFAGSAGKDDHVEIVEIFSIVLELLLCEEFSVGPKHG